GGRQGSIFAQYDSPPIPRILYSTASFKPLMESFGRCASSGTISSEELGAGFPQFVPQCLVQSRSDEQAAIGFSYINTTLLSTTSPRFKIKSIQAYRLFPNPYDQRVTPPAIPHFLLNF